MLPQLPAASQPCTLPCALSILLPASGSYVPPPAYHTPGPCSHSSAQLPFPTATQLRRSFPIAHVALRLEQIAAGLWPTDAATNEPHPDPSRAVRALRAACSRALGGAGAAVLAVYEALLSKRVAGIADGELASAPMRLQLLRSLAALCNVCVDEDLGSSLPSQVGWQSWDVWGMFLRCMAF